MDTEELGRRREETRKERGEERERERECIYPLDVRIQGVYWNENNCPGLATTERTCQMHEGRDQ